MDRAALEAKLAKHEAELHKAEALVLRLQGAVLALKDVLEDLAAEDMRVVADLTAEEVKDAG